MKLGIIGSGNIGQAVATLATRAGHDVVVLAVPWNAIEAAVKGVRFDGRVLVDATNPVLPGFRPANLGGRASSEVVAALVPDARLVKAFNTLAPAQLLTQPETGRRVLFLSGDDADARNTVAQLAGSFGLAPVDLGPLAAAALLTQFPGGPLPALDIVTAERLLAGGDFKPSQNDFDWLGRGVYFWEYGLDRALQFAHDQKRRGKVKTPAVVGALLQLGTCFDLMDTLHGAASGGPRRLVGERRAAWGSNSDECGTDRRLAAAAARLRGAQFLSRRRRGRR